MKHSTTEHKLQALYQMSGLTMKDGLTTKGGIREKDKNNICDKLYLLYYKKHDHINALKWILKKTIFTIQDYINISELYEILNCRLKSILYLEKTLLVDYNIEIALKIASLYVDMEQYERGIRVYENILLLLPDDNTIIDKMNKLRILI